MTEYDVPRVIKRFTREEYVLAMREAQAKIPDTLKGYGADSPEAIETRRVVEEHKARNLWDLVVTS